MPTPTDQRVSRFEPAAGPDGVSRVIDDQGRTVATWWGGNPLREEPPAPAGNDRLPLMLWSGWTGRTMFERDPGCWGPAAFTELGERLHAMRSRGDRRPVLLRPHARHVLNDPQRCSAFLARFGPLNFGLLLDASAMLEDSMTPHASDHLERMFERLGPLVDWVVGDDAVKPLIAQWAPTAMVVRALPASHTG